MVKAHVVQHTHWDREWYFTAEDAKVLSDQVFTEMLNELESNPKVTFCLDGQSSIVDEYIEINPEKLPVIQKLVKEKRLFIGPWYTQTDALLVDAESILRNLIIGMTDTKQKYGTPMMVGYLPDTFGFNANLPTLLNQVGIDNFMAWRGINFEKLVPSPYFNWYGLGGKSVIAMYFPHGYMTGLMTLEAIADLPKFVKEKFDPMIQFLSERGNNEDVLIPSGIDQKSMILDFDAISNEINHLSKYQNVVTDYPSFVEVMRHKECLPDYTGELREPVYSRVHRSIGSVRTQMKLNNFELEQKILRRIEPLMVIARKSGIKISIGLLKRLWKKVLENQAHDSIGGCVSDNVAEDICHRTKEATEISEGLENLILKRIADSLDLTDQQVLVVNTDAKPFKGKKIIHIVSRTKNIVFKDCNRAVIINEKFYPERANVQRMTATGYELITELAYYELDVEINVELPALGYKVIEFEESQTSLEESVSLENNKISNAFYSISFEEGRLILEIKGRHKIYDFLRLTDQGNNGDTYDFSPINNEIEQILNFDNASVQENSSKKTLIVTGHTQLPYHLATRMGEDEIKKEVKFSIHLTLQDDDIIEGKIFFDNQVLSHRLRLQVQVCDFSEESIAQIQNGFTKNHPSKISTNWQKKYVEKPSNLEIFDKSISVENDKSTITVFADGLREYERVNDKLLVTLFATTGELGKPNLAWRPGRASGDTTNEGHIMMATPLAQEIGNHEYTFAIRVTEGKMDMGRIAEITYRRLTPSISYQKQLLNVFINRLDNKIWPLQYQKEVTDDLSILQIPADMLVSSIYPAYTQENHYVLRLANPTAKEQKVSEEVLNLGITVNAAEEVCKMTTIPPFDYLSILISFDK